ncbi:MAG: hypothetical protein K2Y37_06170 [Pirellulales bacterium]|nr:hypothetical protein [Pirellulales bacterium]
MKVRLLGPKAEQELEQFPEGPPPDLLVAAYLAWLLEQVWREIDRRFRGPTVFLNLAAPMDHIENKALKERYLQIIHAAWSVTFSPTTMANGVSLSNVEPLLKNLLLSPVPPTQERKFDVLPETIAPVVSLSLDPRTTTGNYLVMDMGAGTTEASLCMIGGHGAEQRITCYFDQTDLIGADLFSDADRLAGEVRRERTEILCRRLAKLAKHVWYEGFKKDKSSRATHDRWRRLKVLLAGGGTLRREVSETIRETDLLRHWFPDDPKPQVARHCPIGIGAMSQVQDDLGMLATAHGLTVERMQWPIWFPPNEVEVQPQPEVVQKNEAYWYV